MTGMAGAHSRYTSACTAGGQPCQAEHRAPLQLWWIARRMLDTSGYTTAQTDDLRRWAGILIDALLVFQEQTAHLPGSHGHHWQRQLAATTQQRLRPVTGRLDARIWLVHARHRTQTRPDPTLDRRLYRTWIPHLCTAVRALIADSGTAAVQAKHDPATASRLLQARHTLQHACHRLNANTHPSPKPRQPKR
ncbi:hypothetical protein ACFV3E_46160 [Streptomyces sp. NPDC059718]